LLDRLAEGKNTKAIAAELDCSWSTVRRNLSRAVHKLGYMTVEQTVAEHVAEKIKRTLPSALRAQVDLVMRKKT
jgi:DNA-binding NarL/FixJ family response regulator